MTLTVEQIESTYAVPTDATRQNYYPVLAYWIPSIDAPLFFKVC